MDDKEAACHHFRREMLIRAQKICEQRTVLNK